MKNLQVQEHNLSFGSFTLTPTGVITNGMPTFREWEKCGDFIQKANKSVHFWIGDWLNFGEGVYGEDFSQVMDAQKYKYTTLQNDRWVCKRIPPSRRRESLSFSHHQEVADLEAEEQDEMLNLAEKNDLPLSQFRKAVRQYKLKLDIPEVSEDLLEKTDSAVFQQAQECIDASVHAIELFEALDWNGVHVDARDWLVSHLKRAGTFYFSLVKKYDKQKQISD